MKTFILVMDGMSGAGKTTVTKLLLDKLPRTAHIGMDRIKKFISDFERGTIDNAIAREVTAVMARKYLDLGLSIIVDQPFKADDEVTAYNRMALDCAVPCYKFQLYADPDIALQRVIERTKANHGDLTEERAKRNISLFKPRADLGFEMIDTTDLKPEMAAKKILEKISHE